MLIQVDFELGKFSIRTSRQIQMQNRVFRPFLLQRLYRKTLEKFFTSAEVSLHSRYKQTLSESSRTTQKIILPGGRQPIDEGCFIYINKSSGANLFKTLYSYRVQHIPSSIIISCPVRNRPTSLHKDNLFPPKRKYSNSLRSGLPRHRRLNCYPELWSSKTCKFMMTKEEVASIVKYCNDNGVSYKVRLSELGVPEWKFFESRGAMLRNRRLPHQLRASSFS